MDEKLPDLTHLPPRESEMRYFLKHRREWSVEHPRDWVAVVGEEIVALGSDLAIVMAAARGAGHPHPFVGRLEDPALFDAAFVGS